MVVCLLSVVVVGSWRVSVCAGCMVHVFGNGTKGERLFSVTIFTCAGSVHSNESFLQCTPIQRHQGMQNMQVPGFCGAEIQDAGGGVVPDIFQRRPNVDKWRNRAGAVG